jgi:hypothetical protein
VTDIGVKQYPIRVAEPKEAPAIPSTPEPEPVKEPVPEPVLIPARSPDRES